jgi:3-oxoadipate enol-lactonase
LPPPRRKDDTDEREDQRQYEIDDRAGAEVLGEEVAHVEFRDEEREDPEGNHDAQRRHPSPARARGYPTDGVVVGRLRNRLRRHAQHNTTGLWESPGRCHAAAPAVAVVAVALDRCRRSRMSRMERAAEPIVTESTLTVDDGVEIRIVVAQPAAATDPLRTLVLVHGYGGSKEDFQDQLLVWARAFRVVTFDHRGHGSSGHPPNESDYSIERLALDTLAVIDAHSSEPVVLLGHSLGGMIARRIVLAHPAKVGALVLMDTSPGPVPGIDPELASLAAQIIREQGMDVLKAVMDEMSPLNNPAFDRLMVERPGFAEWQVVKWTSLEPAMYAALLVDIAGQPDQTAELAAVSCPTLIIVGQQDGAMLATSQTMADAIGHAEFVVIPDGGHSPQMENGPAYNAALEAFFAGLE